MESRRWSLDAIPHPKSGYHSVSAGLGLTLYHDSQCYPYAIVTYARKLGWSQLVV